jgi:hypothetical protein
MPLSQLVYVSRRTPRLSQRLLDQVVSDSEARNRTRDVTGILLCCSEHVMQLLEGESDVIRPLFERIAHDPRHTAVELLLDKPIRKRMFPEWGMGLADLDKKGSLDRARLMNLIDTVRARTHTGTTSVEGRLLLNDFRQQLQHAA